MTKEEIEQYIDLDNKIKNRIVQISHALHGVDSSSITAITPHVKQCFSNGAYDKEDFIENSNNSPTLFLGMECYDNDDSWTCRINKNLLCLTDEEINKIVDYDKKKKAEDYKRKLEAEKKKTSTNEEKSRRKRIRTVFKTKEEV